MLSHLLTDGDRMCVSEEKCEDLHVKNVGVWFIFLFYFWMWVDTKARWSNAIGRHQSENMIDSERVCSWRGNESWMGAAHGLSVYSGDHRGPVCTFIWKWEAKLTQREKEREREKQGKYVWGESEKIQLISRHDSGENRQEEGKLLRGQYKKKKN